MNYKQGPVNYMLLVGWSTVANANLSFPAAVTQNFQL